MLDVGDPAHPFQMGIVGLGLNAGPHGIAMNNNFVL
jgi:hypothetical protein